MVLEETAVLKWVTSSESGNAYFVLEHSTNGRDFKEITTIDSHGNSIIEHTYSYSHHLPQAGINYYRLWQFDFDGQYENLGVVSLKFDKGYNIHISPNPIRAGNSLQLFSSINGVDFTDAIFSLVNINGQRWLLNLAGEHFLQLPTDISKEFYFLQIIEGQEQHIITLHIQ